MLVTRRCASGEDLEQTIERYCWVYNYHIPQKALHYKAPLAAIKEWQVERPEQFTQAVINEPESGC